jgi:acyl-CoA reductase-like NAD-dependent aldehyde dehydrogenase
MATDRAIIHDAIASTFVTELKRKLGDDLESDRPAPNLISTTSKARLKGLISDAVDSNERANFIGGIHKSPAATSFNRYFR